MPRPFCRRRIGWQPGNVRFFPEGGSPGSTELITLNLDELEAIRLADLEALYQEQAAEKMGISRPTFARILESGRRKVAEALVHGRGLLIGGGPVEVHPSAAGPGPRPAWPGRRRGRCGLRGRFLKED
ncbi:MAG: DUF134 domain-containing protein [Candidatus Saccharicenans sp.]|nr:DUF134 domain-containing protein [Candidatus Saccharicenans sp.]